MEEQVKGPTLPAARPLPVRLRDEEADEVDLVLSSASVSCFALSGVVATGLAAGVFTVEIAPATVAIGALTVALGGTVGLLLKALKIIRNLRRQL